MNRKAVTGTLGCDADEGDNRRVVDVIDKGGAQVHGAVYDHGGVYDRGAVFDHEQVEDFLLEDAS